MQQSYLTMRAESEAIGEFEDRKSRFIAQLVHVETEEQATEHLERMRARHYDARHNVPAWILADGRERASDDGEPQRTSGMPTLEVLRGAGLRDVCCVTTRYFGGTLLGPGGLIRAYTAAAQAAIESARAHGELVEMTSIVEATIELSYADYDRVLDLLKRSGGKVAATDYAADVTLHAVFKAGTEQSFAAALKELLAGRERLKLGKPHFAEF